MAIRSRPAFVSLAAVLLAAPRAARTQDSSSHHPCASAFRSKVVAWRAAHPTNQGNVAVVGIDTPDTPPEVLSHPPLRYPSEAQREGYEGTVIVVALVNEDGKLSWQTLSTVAWSLIGVSPTRWQRFRRPRPTLPRGNSGTRRWSSSDSHDIARRPRRGYRWPRWFVCRSPSGSRPKDTPLRAA